MMQNFDVLRKRMVDQQLISRNINDDKVIDAFLKVPRHLFVELKLQSDAYGDHPLPIGMNQTISQPYMVALMVQCLQLKRDAKVLEIGTGSGYQTAILAQLAKEIYSVERIEVLAEQAKTRLKGTGYNNVKIKCDDGTLGWKEFSPFDGIIVSAGSPVIPDELTKQLKSDGRLVIPLGGSFSQMLTIVRKENEGYKREEVCSCVFVPLIGKDGWKE